MGLPAEKLEGSDLTNSALSWHVPEVLSKHVGAGKLKILATMSETRLADKVRTLPELGIDLSVDAWRGIAVLEEPRRR